MKEKARMVLHSEQPAPLTRTFPTGLTFQNLP